MRRRVTIHLRVPRWIARLFTGNPHRDEYDRMPGYEERKARAIR